MPDISFGMTGTGTWTDWDPRNNDWLDEPGKVRPEDWNDVLLMEVPNGDVTLTAMLAKLNKKETVDPNFNWMTYRLNTQNGDITNIYTAAALTTPYASGGTAGDPLYLVVPEAAAQQCRAGLSITMMQDPAAGDPDWELRRNAEILSVVTNGANSQLHVRLLEDDPATTAGQDLSDANWFVISGDINPEGSSWPASFHYNWKRNFNMTQIFLEPFTITGTQLATEIRGTYSAQSWAEKRARYEHARRKEAAIIFGVMSEEIGDNGQPKRTTDGTLRMLTAGGGVVSDFRTATDDGITYATGEDSWQKSGEDWLNMQMLKANRWTPEGSSGGAPLALCGDMWLFQMNKLLKDTKNYELSLNEAEYGIKVQTWTNVHGSLHFKSYPLFNMNPALAHSCLVVYPEDLTYRPLRGRDTNFVEDASEVINKMNTGHTWMDGSMSGYLTEFGLELHNPARQMWLHGAGFDKPAP